jgi:TRAP-type C4-dicarboxylate transport system substrate-binding protein
VEYSELYSALQNGVIDSEEVNVATVSMQKHYEVVKYINEIGIYPYPIFLAVSNTVLEDAPKPYFDLIEQCFAESNAEYMKTDIYGWSRQTRDDCLKNGTQFNSIKDKAEWQKIMLPLYEREAAKDPLIADFIKAVLALKAST